MTRTTCRPTCAEQSVMRMGHESPTESPHRSRTEASTLLNAKRAALHACCVTASVTPISTKMHAPSFDHTHLYPGTSRLSLIDWLLLLLDPVTWRQAPTQIALTLRAPHDRLSRSSLLPSPHLFGHHTATPLLCAAWAPNDVLMTCRHSQSPSSSPGIHHPDAA